MRLPISLVLIGLPLAEVAGFVLVGSWIGLGATLALTLLSAAMGVLLVRAQGLLVLRRAFAAIERGEPPVREMFDGVLLAAAGALLVAPGFLTDAVGLVLLLPAARRMIAVGILSRAQARRRRDDGVIEGDWIEVVDPLPPPDRRE